MGQRSKDVLRPGPAGRRHAARDRTEQGPPGRPASGHAWHGCSHGWPPACCNRMSIGSSLATASSAPFGRHLNTDERADRRFRAIPRRHSGWLAGSAGRPGDPSTSSPSRSPPIGTGQTGATYRVTADYAADPGALPDTFVIKLPAQDDTVRDRVTSRLSQRMRVLRLGRRSGAGADTAVLPLRDHRRRSRITHCCSPIRHRRCRAIRSPAAARPEARLAATAMAGLHGPTWCDPRVAGPFPASRCRHRERRGDSRGLGDVAKMSADITVEKLGAQAERRQTARPSSPQWVW